MQSYNVFVSKFLQDFKFFDISLCRLPSKAFSLDPQLRSLDLFYGILLLSLYISADINRSTSPITKMLLEPILIDLFVCPTFHRIT